MATVRKPLKKTEISVFLSVPYHRWNSPKKIPQCSSLFMEFNFNHRVVYPLHSNKFPTLAVDLMIMKFPQDEDRRFLAWINCCNGHKQFTTEPFIATTMNFLGWDFFLASLALRLPFSTKLSRFNSWFCSSVGYESHSLKRIKSNSKFQLKFGFQSIAQLRPIQSENWYLNGGAIILIATI